MPVLSQLLGKRSLLVLRVASCHTVFPRNNGSCRQLVLKGRIGSPAAACSSLADSATGGSWTNRASLVSRRIHQLLRVPPTGSSRSGFTRNTASCEAVLREGGLPEHRSELYSRKTSHRAIFSWRPQVAGAALRILRSSLTRGRSPRTPKRASVASAHRAHYHPRRGRRAAERAQRVRGARPVQRQFSQRSGRAREGAAQRGHDRRRHEFEQRLVISQGRDLFEQRR